MKKTIISTLLIICILFSLTACAKQTDIDENRLPSHSDIPITEDTMDNATVDGASQNSASISEVPENNNKNNADITVDEESVISGAVSNQSFGTTETAVGSIVSTNSAADLDYGNDTYTQKNESGFIKTSKNNTSTFAADVDTASYSLIRRYIKNNIPFNSNAVRVEEMLNYFKYDYKEPAENEPFSVNTEVFDCPWNSENKLIKIGLATKSQDFTALPASNIVFLIDVSGSMNTPDKLPLVKEAFSLFSETLDESDRISIVTYASSDAVILDGVSGSDQQKIQTAIEQLQAGGGTYGSKGIITAYELASKHFIKGGNNRVILATDGDLNVGITDTDELEKLITEKKNSGVFLSVMGFGTGNLRDDKLETLADKGNGNYSYIDSKQEARKVLLEEAGSTLITVAKDVKLQTVFNEKAISEYRLIGYENRTLANEDFEDDKKDGGEIGAGHRVTALYEVKPADLNEQEFLKLAIRYKEPDSDTSALKEYRIGKEHYTKNPSEDSIFASAVVQFGMLLAESENVSGSFVDVYNRIANLASVKNDPYKNEFAGLVETKCK